MSERIVFCSSAATSSMSFEELGKAPDGLGAWGVVDDQQWLASPAADACDLLYLSRSETIQAWGRENRPAAPDMFRREFEGAVRLRAMSPLREGIPGSARFRGSASSDRPLPLPHLLGGRRRFPSGRRPGRVACASRQRSATLFAPPTSRSCAGRVRRG